MNTEVIFSSKTEMWETPIDFFEELNRRYKFTLDVCAIQENAKCPVFFSPDQNGLIQRWSGVCWMNPPYGKEIGLWVEKAYTEAVVNGHCLVVSLLPARTDTRWFHKFIYQKDQVDINLLKGRLKFGGSKNSAPFPSMLAVFHPCI
jgi:phage N-6-adenine-methyltransferase